MTKARRRSVPNEPSVPVERGAWPALALLVGSVAYLLLFYAGDLLQGWGPSLSSAIDFLLGDLSHATRIRRIALTLLPAPDVLVDSWVRDDWSRFGLLDHLPVLLGAAIILSVSYFTGALLLDVLRVDRMLTRLERIVLGTAAGLNTWSLFTLCVGLAGGLQQRWIYIVAGAAVLGAAAWRAVVKRRGVDNLAQQASVGDSDNPAPEADAAPWLRRVSFWLSIPFAIFILLGGTLPPTHFDVREYHLQVPKEWFLQGRITFLPHNVYGNMPLGAEMHALIGMALWPGESGWWWGALIGKTVIAAMAPLTALGVYALTRRFFSKTAAAIAGFVFISCPWIAFVSMNGLIDGASAFYSLVSVYAALLCWNSARAPSISSDESISTSGLAALSGFLAGGGVACKYPALLFLAVPVFFVWLLRYLLVGTTTPDTPGPAKLDSPARQNTSWLNRRFDLRAALIYSVAVVAGCGLWFGKNLVLSGNPTYPLLYRWFDGESWNAEKDERWRHAHGPPYNGSWHAFAPRELWNSLLLLVMRSDYISPALWPLTIVGLLVMRKNAQLRLLLVLMLWTMAVWWLMTHRIDRFLVPLLPFVALFAGVGAASQPGQAWAWTVAVLMIWNGATCFVYDTMPLVVVDNRFLISLHEMREDLPRGPDDFTRIHHAHRYLNKFVQPGYRALLVGEAQAFDLEVPILYNTCFDDDHLEKIMRGRSRDERLAALRELRISHVFVYWYELDRYRSPGNYGYSGYATRDLIREELVNQQGLLRPVSLELNPGNGEVLEVVGWQEWAPDPKLQAPGAR